MQKLLLILTLMLITQSAFAQSSQRPPAAVENWSRASPSKCGMSLELPGPTTKENIPLPPELKTQIHYMESYMHLGDGIFIFVVHSAAIRPFATKLLAEGIMQGLIKGPTTADLKYTIEPDASGDSLIDGEYSQSGVSLKMKGVVKSQEKQAWAVLVLHLRENGSGQRITGRVLQSIRMDGSACQDEKVKEDKTGSQR